MFKFQYKTWLSACALLLVPLTAPLTAHAAGLGQIKILSALGQPLRAEIALNATKEELSSLSVKLASPEVFRQANVEYSSALIGIRFSIEERANGTPYVKVTSTRAINDTFIDLLVQLDWAQGQLVREYTALIDPADYALPLGSAAEPTAAAVQPQPTEQTIEPSVPPTTVPLEQPAAVTPIAPTTTSADASSAETAPALTASATTPVTEVSAASEQEASAVQAATPATVETGETAAAESTPETKPDYKVKAGDTLHEIAKAHTPDGVTVEQVLVALFQANPDAFSGKNMNRLKAGKILRQPTYDEITAIAPDDAHKEIRIQTANWNAYRSKLADGAGVTPAQESQSAAGGKIATVEQSTAAQGASKEVVKLSKGDGKTPEARVQALQEEAIAKQKAVDEANMRVAALEKQVNDLKRLLELKGQAPAKPAATAPASATATAAAKTPAPVAPTPATAAVTTPPSAPVVASAPAPAEPKKPKVVAPPPAPEPSLLDDLLNPLYLGALALIVVLVGGYLWYRKRAASGGAGFKKKVSKSRGQADAGEDGDDDLKLMNRTLTMPAVAAASAPASAAASDDVDPIAEADLYLNFGRDAQAEEILKEALQANPRHEAAQIKLLQIYANRKDKSAFEKAARTYHDQVGGVNSTNWMAVAAMGYGLDSANPLYEAGANVDASGLALGAGSQDSAMDLDFDLLSSESTATPDVLDIGGGAASAAPEFDIGAGITDITGGDSAAPDHTLNVSSSEFATLALDVGGPGASSGGGNSMDFSPSAPAAAAPSSTETHDRGPLIPDFKIDFSDLSSDLGGMTLAGPVAGISSNAGASAPAAADDAGISFSDIGLSIDVPSDGTMSNIPGINEVKDAHWFDVQTKFDLAKAYQEMGDKDGAREILQEVIREGDETQKSEAQKLLDSVG